MKELKVDTWSMLHSSFRKFVLLATIHSSVAEWSARGTRKLAVPDSRPALATRWICSRSSRVQNLRYVCVLGFHMTSSKFRRRNYRLFWVSTFMRYYNIKNTLIQSNLRFCNRGCFNFQSFAWRGINLAAGKAPSSETQGQSVGSGEKSRGKFSRTGERAPGYRLSPNHFQKFKRMPAPDWAQKMLCIIMPNRRTVSTEFFSCVRTRRLLSRSRLVWVMHQRKCTQSGNFQFDKIPHLISKYCLPGN